MRRLIKFILVCILACLLILMTACESSKVSNIISDIDNQKTTASTIDNNSNKTPKIRNDNEQENSTALATRPELTITTQKGDMPIKKLIERTKSDDGNPTEEFIKNLRGFKLKILNPWPYYKCNTEPYNSAEYVKSIVERKYGVFIDESGYFEDYEEDLDEKLDNNKVDASIYKVRNVNFSKYLDKEYISSLNKAMKISGVTFKEEWYLQDTTKYLKINNNQYGWLGYDSEYAFPYLIIYNRDLFKKLNLEDPVELMKQKKWTWDKLEDYSQKLIGKFDCSGIAISDVSTFLSAMLATKNTSILSTIEGKLKYNIKSVTFKHCVQTLENWSKKAVVDLYTGEEWDYAKKQFSNGDAAMILGSNDVLNSIKNSSIKSVGIVPFPIENKSDKYTTVYTPQYVDFIPKGYSVEDMAKILFIRNEMYRYAYTLSDRDFKYVYKDYKFDNSTLNRAYELKYKSPFKKLPMLESLYVPINSDVSLSGIVQELFVNSKNDNAYKEHNDLIQKESDQFWEKYKIIN